MPKYDKLNPFRYSLTTKVEKLGFYPIPVEKGIKQAITEPQNDIV